MLHRFGWNLLTPLVLGQGTDDSISVVICHMSSGICIGSTLTVSLKNLDLTTMVKPSPFIVAKFVWVWLLVKFCSYKVFSSHRPNIKLLLKQGSQPKLLFFLLYIRFLLSLFWCPGQTDRCSQHTAQSDSDYKIHIKYEIQTWLWALLKSSNVQHHSLFFLRVNWFVDEGLVLYV